MSNVLARICADKREDLQERKRSRPFAEIAVAAREAPAPRGFASRLAGAVAAGGYGLIAEIKRASPSKGLIRADFNPTAIARAYAAGGATCLSVLTEVRYFQGDDSYLVEAHHAVDLPILRKDFLLDPYQVVESRAIGADCVLLIMAAIDDGQAGELTSTANELGMDVLVEVHDRRELDRAAELKTCLIGINNRNLTTLDVDMATTEALAPVVPFDKLIVSESGLSISQDLARMAAAGVRCFLVGESLMRQADVEVATRALLAPPTARTAENLQG
jgi:indole-3-glycerol phosphate synthase